MISGYRVNPYSQNVLHMRISLQIKVNTAPWLDCTPRWRPVVIKRHHGMYRGDKVAPRLHLMQGHLNSPLCLNKESPHIPSFP